MDPKNLIWTEKYRPKNVDEIVGDFSKIKIYLQKQESIPHFLFHSKTPGTGKCLTGDSMFFTNNGLTSFDDYVKKHNIEKEHTIIEEDVLDINNNFVKTSYFYKSKDKIIKIKLNNGIEIKGTKEHKIKVFDNNGIQWKKLSTITDKDIIPLVYNTGIFGNIDSFNFDLLKDIIYHHNCIDITLPKKINKEIAYMLGVFVANGNFDTNGCTISTKKVWLYDKIKQTMKDNFNIVVGSHKMDNLSFHLGPKKFTDFLKLCCGCSIDTARKKYIPKFIFGCNRDIQMNFLNGLFEDSYLEKCNYITYSTASKQLSKEVQLVLLNLGFYSSIKEKYLEKYKHTYYDLPICAEHSKQFISYFDGIYKNEIIVFDKEENTNVLTYGNLIYDFIKDKRNINNISRQNVFSKDLEKLNMLKQSIKRNTLVLENFISKESYLKDLKIFLDNDIFLDKVLSIEEEEEQNIYDFHIPNTHSFIANGIINHNTTLMKAIVNELDCDYIIINSSDDRKIETIRDKVKEFCLTKSSKIGKRRAILLDEADGMFATSQNALRNIMETYAGNAFFVLTANNINKIIEPIRSRCVNIPFSYPEKKDIYVYLEKICKGENMEYTEDGLNYLIELNYPSIRNCVLSLQDLHTQSLPVNEKTVRPANFLFKEYWEKIKQGDWKTVKQAVLSSAVEPRELNSYLWQKAVEEEKIKVIQLTCRNERDIAVGADSKIIVVTSLIEMCK